MMISQETLLTHKAFQILDKFPLPSSEYIIMSSGIMFALGILDLKSLEDLDVLVTRRGWEKIKNLAPLTHDDQWNCDSIRLHDGLIEIYNNWGPSFYSVEILMKNSYKVGKFQFMSLEDVIKWKKQMGREKDMLHLEMINRYLNSQNQ